MSLQKRTPIRSKAIRDAARDEACTVCGNQNGTTVLAHLNEMWAGKGMGQKSDDIAAVFMCNICHDQYDRRVRMQSSVIDADLLLRALYRTTRRLVEKGIIRIKGAA